jgi:hypothetical protein
VSIELEAARDERPNALGATRNLEDSIADVAAEVVVVLRARGFVPRWLARKVDRHHHAVGDERLESPIHGRSPQSRHIGLSTDKDLDG